VRTSNLTFWELIVTSLIFNYLILRYKSCKASFVVHFICRSTTMLCVLFVCNFGALRVFAVVLVADTRLHSPPLPLPFVEFTVVSDVSIQVSTSQRRRKWLLMFFERVHVEWPIWVISMPKSVSLELCLLPST
jgi:hypothetical protein